MRILIPLTLLAMIGCKDDVAGDLRFTEIEREGVHIEGQWVELTHLHRTGTRSLDGVVAEIGDLAITLPDVDIGPGERFVIATPETEASIGVDLVEDIELGETPALRLFDGDELLHELVLGEGWPLFPGSSVSRDPELADGRDSWCMTWESSNLDFATPGELNGRCRCAMTFDYLYRSIDGSVPDVAGTEVITFGTNGQYSLSTDTQGGEYERGSGVDGQSVSWLYSGTGIRYSGVRAYGEDHWVEQPIEIPADIEAFEQGLWSSVGDSICNRPTQ